MLKRLLISAGAAVLAALGSASAAPCPTGIINPITKISWKCIFPITIAGVSIGGTDQPNQPGDRMGNPICICPSPTLGIPTPGLKVSMSAPTHWVDTNSNKGCMSALGVDLIPGDSLDNGSLEQRADGTQLQYLHTHYYIAPVFAMLDLFTDIPCLKSEGFEVAYLSEVDPAYGNPFLSLFVYPETVLFNNPAAVLSCIADAAASTGMRRPLDLLYYCQGSWGATYPLTGYNSASNNVEGHAFIAAKGVFRMGRLGLSRRSDPGGCYEVPAPLWQKSGFKLQQMLPVKQSSCINIGQSGLLWSGGMGRPTKDNHTFAVFERKTCCVNP
jgi:conjugal transfer pilus assembly protein TraU